VASSTHVPAAAIDAPVLAPPEPLDAPLGPLERIEALCDPGSLHLIRSRVRSPYREAKQGDGDGVVGAHVTIAGRPAMCFAQDSRFAGGSLGEAHAGTIVRVLELAADAAVPVIGFIESAGARMHEGATSLGAYGRVFRANVRLSGRVPQISVVTGAAAGGASYSPALTDFVVMTDAASMFLTGPEVVRAVTGEDVTASELGGPRVHQRNGVCHLVAPSQRDAVRLTRRLLSYLPQNTWEGPAVVPPALAPGDDPGAVLPSQTSRVYDVRDVIRALVDGGELLELAPRWARNVVTAFARIGGAAVGVVANQPRHRGGVLDVASSQKAARFVRTCNAFRVPLVVLVDTPGFMPGTLQENGGAIRHGAKLLHAFAEATVPKLTVVLRQAYGGGFITMNSKDLGADLALAWPGARIGVMGAEQAVAIIHRRRIAAAADPAAERALLVEHCLASQSADAAAWSGVIDEVVEPSATRARLQGALQVLAAKPREREPIRNIPL
jgi:acetyl-CoA carboxylase carboxyltransferase component